ncbi:hypothetical protein GCM10020295_28130 [Streptomyces cinereospinus]
MGRYVVRRLLQMVPVFLGATLLIFLMVHVMGDPIAGLCGERECEPATAARLRQEFGLDQPVWQQYLTYLGNIFAGDFGTAFNGRPVTELMADAFPVTVRLTVVAILFEVLVGVTLGVVTGLRRAAPSTPPSCWSRWWSSPCPPSSPACFCNCCSASSGA